jgi:hypothetical protein
MVRREPSPQQDAAKSSSSTGGDESAPISAAVMAEQSVTEGDNLSSPSTRLGQPAVDVALPHATKRNMLDHKLKYHSYLTTDVSELMRWWPGFWSQGLVEVATPVKDETTLDLLEEKNRACLQEMTAFDCMARLGSYGIRRLFTYSFDQVVEWGWERPNWMASSAVQEQPLLKLTLPMSHASAAFEVYGLIYPELGKGESVNVIKQTYDIYQQLRLGVRALDIPVAFNTMNGQWYSANGQLTVSLLRVFLDVKQFLKENPTEVVIMDLKKAQLHNRSLYASLAPLLADEQKPGVTLPGQSVHNEIVEHLGDYLATFSKISKILSVAETDVDLMNPTVSQLLTVEARVLYFWEGQQVLCTSVAQCQETPGWQQPASGYPFAFGQPMALGQRKSRNEQDVMEPLCLNPSRPSTQTDDVVMLINSLRGFSEHTENITGKHVPLCYPENTQLPPNGEPTLVHRVDAWLSLTESHEREMERLLLNEKELWTHGEALTARSYAESVNYLLLLWYLNKGQQHMYRRINMIATDHVHPSIVHRIVSAMQEQPDCGYTMHCLDTGSCFTQDLQTGTGKCSDEFWVRRNLWDIAERRWFSWTTRTVVFCMFWALVKVSLLVLCLFPGRGKMTGAKGGADDAASSPAPAVSDDSGPAASSETTTEHQTPGAASSSGLNRAEGPEDRADDAAGSALSAAPDQPGIAGIYT